jgi:hypothetical protein
VLQTFMGRHWRPLRVCFSHDAPTDRTEHDRLFGCRVEFGHAFNGIVCSRRDLDIANPTADPGLARMARQMLDAYPQQGSDKLTVQVRQLVVSLIIAGAASRSSHGTGVDRRTVTGAFAGRRRFRRSPASDASRHGLLDDPNRNLAECPRLALRSAGSRAGIVSNSGNCRRADDASRSHHRPVTRARNGAGVRHRPLRINRCPDCKSGVRCLYMRGLHTVRASHEGTFRAFAKSASLSASIWSALALAAAQASAQKRPRRACARRIHPARGDRCRRPSEESLQRVPNGQRTGDQLKQSGVVRLQWQLPSLTAGRRIGNSVSSAASARHQSGLRAVRRHVRRRDLSRSRPAVACAAVRR